MKHSILYCILGGAEHPVCTQQNTRLFAPNKTPTRQLDIYHELFTYTVLKKCLFSYFIWTYLYDPKTKFPSFYTLSSVFATYSVKSRLKWSFYPWQKKNKMQSFVYHLYIWSNIIQISSHITAYNKTHNQVHKYIAIKWAYQMHKNCTNALQLTIGWHINCSKIHHSLSLT